MLSHQRGEHGADATEKKFRDYAEVMRGSDKIDGLFTLHRKDEHLYAEIKPSPVRPALAGAYRHRQGPGDGPVSP